MLQPLERLENLLLASHGRLALFALFLDDLRAKKQEALHPGGGEAERKQHARGKLTARERLELLLDKGSFVETDMMVRHRGHDFGMEKNRPYGDGVVTGWGTVDGRKVRIRVIDANSETLTADLLAGFRASVRHAREENRDLGLTD